WDDEYLYTCVSLLVGSPRTYGNTDYLSTRPYIFDRRHVMSAIVLDNPRLPKFQPATGENWDWSSAYNSGLGTEWTITAQPDGTNIKADHFGSLTQAADYEYIVAVSDLDREYYEQKIPWSALAGAGDFTAEVGAMIGYSFSCCCEEVDIELEDGEDDTAVYVCFGNGIVGYKHFGEYVGLTLTEE
ncbi:MAG: hypothetical protein IJD82_05660, partial [Clostridia bacterium]|nr:hypothetical protein [Clostridia bacterium]